MTIYDMKYCIKKAPKYTSSTQARNTWHSKVDKMTDQQIIAVYFRLKRAKEI